VKIKYAVATSLPSSMRTTVVVAVAVAAAPKFAETRALTRAGEEL